MDECKYEWLGNLCLQKEEEQPQALSVMSILCVLLNMQGVEKFGS